MTTQIKQFIELGDVLSLRFTCKKCQIDLLLSQEQYAKQRQDATFLSACPICHAPWAQVNGSTCEPMIHKFVESFNALSQTNFPMGFSLSLEIRCTAFEAEKAKSPEAA